ncbi:MAG: CDP-alcohol phosphatidyltransferase family protein [Flavobacterium sp.]|nr:CDP-alcohol phosphatidyltransferase family protein [Flavobacterium sp.]
MNLRPYVPNTITLLNLFSGCIALHFAFQQNYLFAFYFVALGIFLDFFDGFFARMFQVSGPLGVQLDSLADMVTSGTVPGVVMFLMMSNSSGSDGEGWVGLFPYLGFIITLASCYRLAKFNIDTRQTNSFIGLPTPANALFIISLPLVLQQSDSLLVLGLLTDRWLLLGITLLSAYLLNAEIPLFSLKIKKFSFRENSLQIIFLLMSVVLLIAFRYSGVPIVILLYVLLSVITNKLRRADAKA